jgi:heme exporter protein D
MHFDSWSAFWAMGGYGLFVWLAFGVSILALVLLIVDSIFARRGLFADVLSEVARKQRIKAAKIEQEYGHQKDAVNAGEKFNES